MGKLADLQIQKLTGILNIKIKAEELRFGIPLKFKAIKLAAISVLNPFVKDIKGQLTSTLRNISSTDVLIDNALGALGSFSNISDNDMRSYVRTNPNLKSIIQWAENDMYLNTADNISLACSDEEILNSRVVDSLNKLSNADGNTFVGILSEETELPTKDPNVLYGTGQVYPWLFLAYWLISNVVEWITTNRYPSPNRRKYLQSIIRSVGSQLKAQLENSKESIKSKVSQVSEDIKDKERRVKENLLKEGTAIKQSGDEVKKTAINEFDRYKVQLEKMIKTLATLDNILIAVGGATLVYLENRGHEQENSEKQLEALTILNTCTPPDSFEDPSIVSTPFTTDGFTCPIDIDTIIVPHEPIDEKLENLNCELLVLEEAASIIGETKEDIATLAMIENMSPTETFKIDVTVGSSVLPETLVGSIGDTLIYSPVLGTVSNIEENKVFLSDISDSGTNLIEQTTEELNAVYEELSNTKEFIKGFFINSQLPVLLDASPAVDSSDNLTSSNSNVSFISGVTQTYEKEVENGTRTIDIFNKNIQIIAGQDNVKQKAENEELDKLKEEYDNEEKTMYDNLDLFSSKAINIAGISYAKKQEFVLIEYYIQLIGKLNAFDNQNNIVTSYIKNINEFIIDRFYIDKFNLENLQIRINELANKLNESYFFNSPNFFDNINTVYNNNLSGNPEKAAKDYIESIKKNSKLETTVQDDLIAQIKGLFVIIREILDINKLEDTTPKRNVFEQTVHEANFINIYFGNLWNRLNDLPIEIDELLKKIEDLALSFVPPAIRVNDEGREYQWYGVKGPERTCPIPEEDNPYLSPYTEIGMGDIRYWLKYCAFATLASVINPSAGWATGFPPPIGPILFPVVYLPFKSFETKWGFIVVGLTITGIYPFPWVLFTNYSTNYNTPFGNPTALLKKGIESLKKSLSDQTVEFKQSVLKGYLTRTKKEVDTLNAKVDQITEDKREHKLTKPKNPRYPSDTPAAEKIRGRLSYTKKLETWTENQVIYTEQLTSTKAQRFVVEKKYDIIYKAFSGDSKIEGDEKLVSFQKQQEQITAQLDKLNVLVDKLDKFLIPLPITMSPQTANFAFTPKSPKIINQWSKDLDDNVNQGAIDKVIEKFEPIADDYMSGNFKNTQPTYGKLKTALKLAMPTMIKKDPFPKYENLSPVNLSWSKFLYTKWAVSGAQTYGIPGQPPFSIS